MARCSVTRYRFTVTYEGVVEADDPVQAREWAREDVEAGRWDMAVVEVEPVEERKDAPNGD